MPGTVEKQINLGDGQQLIEARAYTFGKTSYGNFDKTNVSNVMLAEDSRVGGLEIIAPRTNALELSRLLEYSGILGSLTDAMAVNIDCLGYELEARHKDEELTEQELTARDEEYARLIEFFRHINPDQSFTELRYELRIDRETTGRTGVEIVRNRIGEIEELVRVPSIYLFMTKRDREYTEYEINVIDEITGEYKTKIKRKRFRRYVQLVNGKKVFFKEFLDPRPISYRDGSVLSSANPNEEANELIYLKIFCPHDIYGQPRWYGNRIKIYGLRKSEEVNYFYFDNRAVPEFMITVSGGTLTSDSIQTIKNAFKQIKGTQNAGRSMVLEAVPFMDKNVAPGDQHNAVKIDVKPLTMETVQDALFTDYQKNAKVDARMSFRLPPLIVGDSSDYTRATAKESIIFAEGQVFKPWREQFDALINDRLFPAMEVKYWKFKSKGHSTTDKSLVARAMSPYKEQATLDMIYDMWAKTANVEVPEVPQEFMGKPLFQIMREITPIFPENPEDVDDNQVKIGLKAIHDFMEKVHKERNAAS